MMFSKYIGVRDSNEVKALAILEALLMFRVHQTKVIVKSDSSDAIAWVSASNGVLGSSTSFLMRSRCSCRVQSYFALHQCYGRCVG